MFLITKQKKATSIAITILVILVLVLAVFTLFMMFTGTKNLEKKIIAPAYVLESASSQEEQSAFYSKQILEMAFVKTYYEFVSGRSIQDWKNTGFSYDISYFRNEFESGLIRNLKVINNKIKTESFKELSSINKKISEGDFKIILDEAIENAEFLTPLDIKIAMPEDLGIDVEYKPDIKASVSSAKIGLNNIQEVLDKIKTCNDEASIDKMKECFNQLNYFDVKISSVISEQENKEFFTVTLTSKKKFLIDDELKKVKITFILEKQITS